MQIDLKVKESKEDKKIGLFSPFSAINKKNQVGTKGLYSQNDLLKLKEQISDLKNLNESIAKQLEDLEYQAQMIQLSTKTTFFFFVKAHNFLRTKSKIYYKWHLKQNASTVHLVVLVIFAILSTIGAYIKLVNWPD